MQKKLLWFISYAVGFVLMVLPYAATAASSVDKAQLELLFSSNTKEFIQLVDKLMAIPSNQLDKTERIELSYYAGLAAMTRSDYSNAELYLKQVADGSEDLVLKHRAIVSLVNLHQHTGNFYQAFSLALRLSEAEFGDLPDDNKAAGTMAMALALLDSGLYEEAGTQLKQFDFSTVSSRIRCTALFLTAQIAYKSDIFTKKLPQIELDNAQCYQDNHQLYALLTDSALAIIYLNQNQPDKALKLLTDKRSQAMAFGYENLSVIWQAQLVNALVAQRQLEEALREAAELENYQSSSAAENSLEVALLMYQSLTSTYKQAGNTLLALDYSDKLYQTYQKSHNRQMTAALAYYAALMQAAQRKQEISLLNQQTRGLQLENELAKAESVNQKLYLLVTGTLLMLLVTVLYRSHRSGVKLKERVTFDKLTRVFSRDHFEDVLTTSLAQAESQQQKLGFVLFDLDNFKQVNDTYGHQTGDWVLQQAANAAQQCLRKSDAIGRIGGEEFAILLQDCDLSMSRALAESVRLAIADIDTTPTGHKFSVSASFGVSTAQGSGYSARRLFSNADEALYQAKQSGRNKVMPEEPDDIH